MPRARTRSLLAALGLAACTAHERPPPTPPPPVLHEEPPPPLAEWDGPLPPEEHAQAESPRASDAARERAVTSGARASRGEAPMPDARETSGADTRGP